LEFIMKKGTQRLLVIGALGAGAYYLIKQSQTAPSVAVAPAAIPSAVAAGGGVSGLGYYPSGSDRPFARYYNRRY
jgi:hypothetical protein